jgi:type II secretory pathway component PulM
MYIPVFVIAVVAVWWLFMRPANLAARERQDQLQREQDRLRQVEKEKEALAELETFRWQKKLMSGGE